MAVDQRAKTSAARPKKRSSNEAVTLSGEPISKVLQAAQEMKLKTLKKAYAKGSSPKTKTVAPSPD